MRVLGEQLRKSMPQPVVIENRAGADGNIGTDFIAKSAPDGYTIGVAMGGPVAIGKQLFPGLPYDPEKDLAPVIFTTESPLVLVVNPAVKAQTVKELLALAKANPSGYNIAVSGNGSTQHFLSEMLNMEGGVKMQLIPYKGGGPALTDVVGGQVQMAWAVLPAALPFVQSGKLRALAVSSKTRSTHLPNVPTMIEAGYPNIVGTSWNGIIVPAGTPKDVVDRLNAAFAEALKDPEVKAKLSTMGMDAVGGSPAEFGAFIRDEGKKWGGVIKAAGITAN